LPSTIPPPCHPNEMHTEQLPIYSGIQANYFWALVKSAISFMALSTSFVGIDLTGLERSLEDDSIYTKPYSLEVN
jgi:hypothetical protein